MANSNVNVPSGSDILKAQAKARERFGKARKALEAARAKGKVNKEDFEKYMTLINNKETRAVYQIKRNARPDVIEARKKYNRDRYEESKKGTKGLKALGIL